MFNLAIITDKLFENGGNNCGIMISKICSPVKDSVVVNDRWGPGTLGKHGGYLTYADEFDPGNWQSIFTYQIKIFV